MNIKSLYLNVINNLYDGVFVVDNQRRILFWNKSAEAITGHISEEVVGYYCHNNLLHHVDEEGRSLCTKDCPVQKVITEGKIREENIYLKHKDGHRIAIKSKILPVIEDGKTIGSIEIFKPLTHAQDIGLMAELTSLALRDPLTHLYNRRYMENLLEHKINEFERFGILFCVLFIDIDNFSYFNNTYGHDVGDKVLKSISATFINNLRKSDVIARWGGEEFVGIFEITKESQTTLVGEKIRLLVQATEIISGEMTLGVTVSLGVTMVKQGDTSDSIVVRADKLMYQSKQNNKNCVTTDIDGVVYTEIQTEAKDPKELLKSLEIEPAVEADTPVAEANFLDAVKKLNP